MPAIECGGSFYPCVTFCHSCTKGIRARQLPDDPVDILTCSVCRVRRAVHRGQRLPCTTCGEPPLWKSTQKLLAERRAAELAAGFEHIADARCNLLSTGGRSKQVSDQWLRHQACGRIGPRWQRPFLDRKTGEVAPPYCRHCGGEPWRSSSAIPPGARDLLYLVRFTAPGLRFLKVGRSLTTQDRLAQWLGLGARVVQVVEARHDKVSDAERRILRACADYRIETHPFKAHFGTDETLRLGARTVIGELTTWSGRSRDRTQEWIERARQRHTT
ncbi:hypothetical protein [Kribbella shirazensis]|uniref:Uncharacterized protein n=1 Tax=Kribbella shirazensis TaxID=1105143 RepID=A0A7X6A3G5_9ACTN|nr:hypothetical protein [Kribbella shirazensis]NIK59868.1 hypothetical protein [Kribbella shirazensis]